MFLRKIFVKAGGGLIKMTRQNLFDSVMNRRVCTFMFGLQSRWIHNITDTKIIKTSSCCISWHFLTLQSQSHLLQVTLYSFSKIEQIKALGTVCHTLRVSTLPFCHKNGVRHGCTCCLSGAELCAAQSAPCTAALRGPSRVSHRRRGAGRGGLSSHAAVNPPCAAGGGATSQCVGGANWQTWTFRPGWWDMNFQALSTSQYIDTIYTTWYHMISRTITTHVSTLSWKIGLWTWLFFSKSSCSPCSCKKLLATWECKSCTRLQPRVDGESVKGSGDRGPFQWLNWNYGGTNYEAYISSVNLMQRI